MLRDAALRLASRAAPALAGGSIRPAAGSVGWVRARGYCDGGSAAGGEEDRHRADVECFLAALGIEEKYAEKIPNMAALLHETKTEHLKKEGMKVTDRKKLLSHVEKYKRGLWAPKELRERT